MAIHTTLKTQNTSGLCSDLIQLYNHILPSIQCFVNANHMTFQTLPKQLLYYRNATALPITCIAACVLFVAHAKYDPISTILQDAYLSSELKYIFEIKSVVFSMIIALVP